MRILLLFHESKRIQVGVFQYESQAHRLADEVAQVVAVLPTDKPLDFVAEDLRTVFQCTTSIGSPLIS